MPKAYLPLSAVELFVVQNCLVEIERAASAQRSYEERLVAIVTQTAKDHDWTPERLKTWLMPGTAFALERSEDGSEVHLVIDTPKEPLKVLEGKEDPSEAAGD